MISKNEWITELLVLVYLQNELILLIPPWSPCVPCNTSNLLKITSRNSVQPQTSDRLAYFGRSTLYHKIQKSQSTETEELLRPNCISNTKATRRRRGGAKNFSWYSLDWKRNRQRTNWPKIVHSLNGKRKIPKTQKRQSENQWRSDQLNNQWNRTVWSWECRNRKRNCPKFYNRAS